MKSATTKIKQRVPEKKERSLAEAEKRLCEAEASFTESFFEVGEALSEIHDWHLWKEKGYKSWGEYCKQETNYSKQHANRLIKAAKIRPELADISEVEPNGSSWTESQVRELARMGEPTVIRGASGKTFTHQFRGGWKRVSKKIYAQVEKGEKLTANLVKRLVDDDLGIPKQKAERKKEKEQALHEESMRKWKESEKTPDEMIEYLASHNSVTCDEYEKLIPETWDEVTDYSFDFAIEQLTKLADFLKAKQRLAQKKGGKARKRFNAADDPTCPVHSDRPRITQKA